MSNFIINLVVCVMFCSILTAVYTACEAVFNYVVDTVKGVFTKTVCDDVEDEYTDDIEEEDLMPWHEPEYSIDELMQRMNIDIRDSQQDIAIREMAMGIVSDDNNYKEDNMDLGNGAVVPITTYKQAKEELMNNVPMTSTRGEHHVVNVYDITSVQTCKQVGYIRYILPNGEKRTAICSYDDVMFLLEEYGEYISTILETYSITPCGIEQVKWSVPAPLCETIEVSTKWEGTEGYKWPNINDIVVRPCTEYSINKLSKKLEEEALEAESWNRTRVTRLEEEKKMKKTSLVKSIMGAVLAVPYMWILFIIVALLAGEVQGANAVDQEGNSYDVVIADSGIVIDGYCNKLIRNMKGINMDMSELIGMLMSVGFIGFCVWMYKDLMRELKNKKATSTEVVVERKIIQEEKPVFTSYHEMCSSCANYEDCYKRKSGKRCYSTIKKSNVTNTTGIPQHQHIRHIELPDVERTISCPMYQPKEYSTKTNKVDYTAKKSKISWNNVESLYTENEIIDDIMDDELTEDDFRWKREYANKKQSRNKKCKVPVAEKKLDIYFKRVYINLANSTKHTMLGVDDHISGSYVCRNELNIVVEIPKFFDINFYETETVIMHDRAVPNSKKGTRRETTSKTGYFKRPSLKDICAWDGLDGYYDLTGLSTGSGAVCQISNKEAWIS